MKLFLVLALFGVLLAGCLEAQEKATPTPSAQPTVDVDDANSIEEPTVDVTPIEDDTSGWEDEPVDV